MEIELKDVIKGIEDGSITNLDDIIFSSDELLTKDNNGLTFLEKIFDKGMSLNYRTEEEIKNNIEIAYIYCKYNKLIYFFDLEEESLFSKKNDKKYIEYFIENKSISQRLINKIINKINKHLEIIDLLIDKNKINYCEFLSPEIINKLTQKNNDGVYTIEKYLNNKKVSDKLLYLINDPNVLIELSRKYNNMEFLKKANVNALLYQNQNGDSFLEFLINKVHVTPDLLTNVPKNTELIRFLINNNLYEYLVLAEEDTLLVEIEQNKTLLEYLIENEHPPEFKDGVWKEKTLKILKDKNKLELPNNVNYRLLLKSSKDVFGLDTSNENKTVLEYMLDNGCNPLKNASFVSEEFAKMLYNKKRPDLLVKVSTEKLLENLDGNNTYFDYILESIKENKIKQNLRDLFPRSLNLNLDTIVKYYLKIAEHGMIDYIIDLTEDNLLKKYGEKTLLDGLLEANSSLTLDVILTKMVKSNPKIAVILESKGIKQKNVDISSNNPNYTAEYLEKEQNKLGIGPLPQEGEFLLKQLEQLFSFDGKSDEELISALISGYRQSLFVNYELNIKEIQNLIKVKQENIDTFFYLKVDKGAYFSPSKGSVFSSSSVVGTILHETGHALHYYLTKNAVPENYQEIISNVRFNPTVLEKVEKFSNEYDERRNGVSSLVEQKYKSFFEKYYNENKKNEIREFILKEKETKKNEFNKLGIQDEQLEIILNGMYTEEEYIEHQKRIFQRESTSAITRSEFGGFMAIGDILDAIYEGQLYCEQLKNQQGKNIKGTSGHGIAYYYDTNHGFDEMVANFASISKSKDSIKNLNLLREIVGDEMYNMLSEFYYNNIVNKEENLETRKSIGGK